MEKTCWYCGRDINLDSDEYVLVPMKGIHFIFCPDCHEKGGDK